MSFVLKDRVEETTTSTGLGNITLAGATTGSQAFDTVMADNDTTVICIAGGGQWLVCDATYDQDTNVLIRGTAHDGSSGSGTNVDFSAGTKNVFMVAPAQYLALLHTDSTWKPYGRQGLWVPYYSMLPHPTTGPQRGQTMGSNQLLGYDAYDTTTIETSFFEILMPYQWDEGTITFDYSWMHPSTSVNFGVTFGLSAVAVSNDDPADAAYGAEIIVADTGGTTTDHYRSAESSAVTVAGTPQAGDMLCCKLRRVTSDAGDTLAVDAYLRGLMLWINTVRGNDAA